jgi:hypothetical protein
LLVLCMGSSSGWRPQLARRSSNAPPLCLHRRKSQPIE